MSAYIKIALTLPLFVTLGDAPQAWSGVLGRGILTLTPTLIVMDPAAGCMDEASHPTPWPQRSVWSAWTMPVIKDRVESYGEGYSLKLNMASV